MPASERSLLAHWFVTLGAQALRLFERKLAEASLVGDPAFFEADEFPWTHEVEERWPEIRQELERLLAHREALPSFQDVSPDQRHLTSDDGWKTFFLYAFGEKAEAACALCPETTAALAHIPGMKTAFFSILAPGKHIPPHRGAFKGVLRYHLGVKVPRLPELARIRVGEQIRHWERGKSLVFDDTYEHEVWNESEETRVVLFVDFVRPLRFPFDWINAGLLALVAKTPFVKDGAKRYEAFEKTFDSVFANDPPPVRPTAMRPRHVS